MICLLLAGSTTIGATASFFNVLDYGAKGNGITLSTGSIQASIDACSKSGGGTVLIPAGKYLSGTIFLKSQVTLLLEAGAVLTGSKDLKDYPVTVSKIRSYTDNYTDKSLIYGEDLENIAITGEGTIDGNGAYFQRDWPYKSRPYMIRMINCKKIRIRDVSLVNSPMWVQHYLSCEDVSIQGITVKSRVNWNNDGIDIDGCDNVRISDCFVWSGDDAIVLKSTLNKPCNNVTITGCILSSDCNAFKLGTETNGGFQNITLTNCTIYDTRLAGITLQVVDGGTLDRVSISHVSMSHVGTAIFIRLGNRARSFTENMPKPGMGKLSNVFISDVQATGVGSTGCAIAGLPGYPVENIELSNMRLKFTGRGTKLSADREIQEFPDGYPEYEMFGMLPAYGFYCRHAVNLGFDHVELDFEGSEARPAMVFDDISGLELQNIRGRIIETGPLFRFINVRDASVRLCSVPFGLETFLRIQGRNSGRITLWGNDLNNVKIPVLSEDSSEVYIDNNRVASRIVMPVSCEIQNTDDRELKIHSPADAARMKLGIIRAIWGKDRIPDRSDVFVTPNVQSPLNPASSVSRVDRIEVPVEIHGAYGSEPIKDLAYLFVPVSRNNRLVIINPGHSCTIKADPKEEHGFRVEETITGLLQAGFDVLAVFMPHVTDTACILDHCSIINTRLGPGDYPSTFGLRFFLEPEIVSLNYLLQHNKYQNVNMVGLSGGGWTTNLLAAIDDRIRYSFSVAGSMPLYYRYGTSMGDIEQFLPGMYRDIAGYPDLYVLGALGKGRKQVQILNRHDDCCFGEKQHNPERKYDTDLRTFEQSVIERLNTLGARGHYYLAIDEEAPCHQISGYALNEVILKELMGTMNNEQ